MNNELMKVTLTSYFIEDIFEILTKSLLSKSLMTSLAKKFSIWNMEVRNMILSYFCIPG